jgi:hypothetical protein
MLLRTYLFFVFKEAVNGWNVAIKIEVERMRGKDF